MLIFGILKRVYIKNKFYIYYKSLHFLKKGEAFYERHIL